MYFKGYKTVIKKLFFHVIAIVNKGDIYIHGEIGDDSWSGASDWGIVGQKHIINELEVHSDKEEIDVHIHSGGGSVFEGWAMYHALNNSGKKINVKVNGLAASMGSVLSLLGETKDRSITKGSQFMIHNPWSMAVGNADDLQSQVDHLREIENEMIDFYHAKTGYNKEYLRAEMKEETWFGSESAKAKGFVGNVIEFDEEKAKEGNAKIEKAKEYFSSNNRKEEKTAEEFLALMKSVNGKKNSTNKQVKMSESINAWDKLKSLVSPNAKAKEVEAKQEEVKEIDLIKAKVSEMEKDLNTAREVVEGIVSNYNNLSKDLKAEYTAKQEELDAKIKTVEEFAKAKDNVIVDELPKEEFKKADADNNKSKALAEALDKVNSK